MIKAMTSGKRMVCVFLPILLVGCQSASRTTGPITSTSQIPQLTSAYHAVTSHRQDPHPSTRLPVRKARRRNLRILAEQCEKLLKDVDVWDSDARLTSIEASDRDEVRITVAAFRESLQNLSLAADKSRISSVRQHYAAASASYRRLLKVTGVITESK